MSRLTTKTSRVFGKSSPTKTKTTIPVSDNNNLRVKIWNSDTMQFEISIADGIAASATSNCHQTVTTILKQTPLQRSDCYETENISPAITINQPIFEIHVEIAGEIKHQKHESVFRSKNTKN
ncbi:uncharacterized protein LOC141536869 [Cotesia typhae]|uniref:uncharacterized protein LOC141536869 n=1 Tax=Cotesia typhae TaxID=2053667 RepID=UPI003D69B01F